MKKAAETIEFLTLKTTGNLHPLILLMNPQYIIIIFYYNGLEKI